MKLYDTKTAPNPRRVRVFIAEKGIEIPTVQVDLGKGEHRTAEYRDKVNEMMKVPTLQLDDGRCLSETVAICRYLEGLHPEPNLMGKDSTEQALIEMWNRRIELNLSNSTGQAFRHSSEFFAKTVQQIPEWAAQNRQIVIDQFQWLDGVLGRQQFIAGDRYTIADITALCAVDFAKLIGVRATDEQKNLKRWYEAVAGRPSAKA